MNEPQPKYGLRKDPVLYQYIVDSYKKAQKFKEELRVMEKAEKYDLYYNNEPWKAAGTSRADHLSEVKIAIAFDVIETGLPIVTARAPMPDVDPMVDNESKEYQAIADMEDGQEKEAAMDQLKEGLDDYAEKIQRELIAVWNDTKMQKKQRIGYRENGKTGNMFFKSEFDPKEKKWKNINIDLSTIYPAPNIESIEAHVDAEEPFIFAPVMTVDKVKKRYGVTKLDEGSLGSYDDLKTFSYETSFLNKVKAGIKAKLEQMGNNVKGTHVILIECYMPDNAESEVDVTDYNEKGAKKLDEEGNEIKKKVTRKNFESGFKRVAIVLDHKDWILEEVENKFKRPPIFGTVNYQQVGGFYGISEIQNIEDLITIMNVSASNFNDNLRYTGNPTKVVTEGSHGTDNKPITNEIGGINYTQQPGGVYYAQPPQLGHDVKWWLGDFLPGWVKQITHTLDALRGVNEFSQDSGKKVRELRNAAHGAFQPKLDEQVDFIKDLFQYWVFVIQNYYQHTIMQKVEDDDGKANYEEFNPQTGREFKMSVDVSADSILPDDPFAEFDEALELYDRGMKRTGEPLVSPEHLIDLAVHMQDKQRAKNYLAKKENEGDQQMFEQFVALAEQAADVSENEGSGDNEDKVVIQLIEILTEYPMFFGTNEFLALPEKIRLALLAGVAKERSRKAA
jgi:hypothetical protein